MSKARNLNRLAYFAAVVETGSFTRAADRLGVTKAVVSAQVTQLELELKTTLLVRNTRKVSATEAGQAFYTRCAAILHDADDAFGELAQLSDRPLGTLRMTAPHDYGTVIVTPVVAAFRRKYPECKVELHLGDSHSDLMSGDLDLAIRVGWLRDSGLMARKIGGFQQLLVGASKVEAQFDTITHPNDLKALDFIANMSLSDPLQWVFENEAKQSAPVKLENALSIDSGPAILEAVKGGAGVAILPDFLVRRDLQNNVLTRILPQWTLPEGGIFAVYPASKFRPIKVSAFVDMLRNA
ncbi:MAG: LysR substrate-binding domain-containing protein [Pelagimonas sp.]|uniref:LysR family transcriptional regulator n=1 Tax=Pelagimonas sp. TaxID=2073170 RepID=UPI003D6A6B1E